MDIPSRGPQDEIITMPEEEIQNERKGQPLLSSLSLQVTPGVLTIESFDASPGIIEGLNRAVDT